MPIRLRNSLLALTLAASTLVARAHMEADEGLPPTPGLRVGTALALRSLSAPEALPSQGLPGYLLQGDAGTDWRGGHLEHGLARLGWRVHPRLGALLAVGAHGADPAHVETAAVQFQLTPEPPRVLGDDRLQNVGVVDDIRLTAGRLAPTLGPDMGRAGHLDRFGLMPLAKQAVLNGDWVEEGAELGVQRRGSDDTWRLDAGLWRGRGFPAARGTPVFPSLHAGANLAVPGGELSADAWAAWLKPDARGSRLANAPGGHTHVAPVCDARLAEVVCFEGRSRVGGVSARWQSTGEAVELAGAWMWRRESGHLQSRNGLADYDGHTRGGWLEALWRPASRVELGLRQERLSAGHALMGPGARFVSAEAGFSAYAPQRRTTAMLGLSPWPWADVRAEAGHERASGDAVRFIALRLVLRWDQHLELSP